MKDEPGILTVIALTAAAVAIVAFRVVVAVRPKKKASEILSRLWGQIVSKP